MPLIPGPIPISAKNDVVWNGHDSIALGFGNTDPTTDDYDPGRGAMAFAAHEINAELQRRAAPPDGAYRVGQNATWAKPRRVKWKQDGLSGHNLAQLLASLSARCLVYNPTVVLIGNSPNDWTTSGYGTELDQLWAVLRPLGIKLGIVSSFLGQGEKVQQGPDAWGLNISDPGVAGVNFQAKAWCAANGVVGDPQGPYWIDIRGTTVNDPNTIAFYENLYNTGNATDHVFTVDGYHPWYFKLVDGVPTGQQIYSRCLLANLAVDYA